MKNSIAKLLFAFLVVASMLGCATGSGVDHSQDGFTQSYAE
jgi:hypothetical protein